MHYRNGVENPRNIVKVTDDGRETTIAVVRDPDDARLVADALNRATAGGVLFDAAMIGCKCHPDAPRSANGRVISIPCQPPTTRLA